MVSSIEELHQKYRDQGLVIIGIDLAEDVETVRAFVEAEQLTYLNLIGDREVFRAYEVTAHPLVVTVTSEGKVHARYLGWRSLEGLEEIVQRILK